MSTDIFSISISALQAAQMGLATTENNIANASTPGYNRELTIQDATAGQGTASGFIGGGVNVSTVQRQYSQFLTTQVNQQQGVSSQLNTYYSQIQQVNNMLGSTTSGLAPALQNFFSAVNSVANAPDSTPSRQNMISNAQALTQTVQSMSQQLANIGTGINGQIKTDVQSINSDAQQIALLNKQITLAQADANGQPPNQLMDQRDQLVNDLNKLVGVNVIQQGDGSYNVSFANGQLLVAGSLSYGLQAVPSTSDASQLDVAYGATGNPVALPSGSIQGGDLGGLLAFRSQSLIPTQNQLGLIAAGVSGTFNQQNQLGMDLNGNQASSVNSFFVDPPPPQVTPNTLNSGTAQVTAALTNYSTLTGSEYTLSYDGTNYTLTNQNSGAASVYAPSPLTAAAGTNTGTGTISAATAEVSAGYSANAVVPTTLTFNSPANTLTGFPANMAVTVTSNGVSTTYAAGTPVNYTSGATISFGGLSFSISGSPQGGDQFTVNPAASQAATIDLSNSDGFSVSIPTGAKAGDSFTINPTANAAADMAVAVTDPAKIAAALPVMANASLSNLGSATISPGSVDSSYTSATVTPPVTLTYDSATNMLSGFPANMEVTVSTNSAPPVVTTYPAGTPVPYSSGATISFGGASFTMSGTPGNGDTFTIAANSSPATDNRNALLLANLQTANTMLGGTASYTGVYGQLVAQVGNTTSQLNMNSTAQTNLMNNTIQSQQAISGVNLDEEAANLILYQQAYQAAGKAMQVANTLFDTLISIGK